MELSVPPANVNEVPATKVLTSGNYVYLKRLRGNFHDSIYKLDENYTLSDPSNDTPSNLSNDEENNERDR